MVGAKVYRNINLLATGQVVKASPGKVYGYHIFNAAAAARFVKLYNQTGTPTPASDTPAMTIRLPAATDVFASFAGDGIEFGAGIGVIATQLIADTDTTAPAANDVVVNLLYR